MRPQPESTNTEVLAGLIERVTYHNSENGFCVLRAKVRGHRDVVTVVGHAAAIAAGEWITASGDWVNDRTHGQQFKARFLRTSPPSSADGIERYLSSGMIRGVGPVYAKKLVRAFGEKVFDVIEATPDRLREVDGIGRVRAASILAAWAEQKAVREIMVFLHSHGVGTARAVRIFKTYGADAIQVMTENPYRLARDIRGIGFKTADAIAMKLGIEKTAMVRVRAGISYALTEAMDEGHCGLPTDELVPPKLLEVAGELVRTALQLELTEGTVIADRVGEIPCVFLAGLHRAERTIAERLTQLANGTLPWPWIDPDKALPWVEKRIGFALAKSQVAAIRLALISKVLVMTGGPGVGKTTIIKAGLGILAAKGVTLLLCAEEGCRHRRQKRFGPTAVVEAAGMAPSQPASNLKVGRYSVICRTAVRPTTLSFVRLEGQSNATLLAARGSKSTGNAEPAMRALGDGAPPATLGSDKLLHVRGENRNERFNPAGKPVRPVAVKNSHSFNCKIKRQFYCRVSRYDPRRSPELFLTQVSPG
jgi:exodeoxyribonuclease V alpha subunit